MKSLLQFIYILLAIVCLDVLGSVHAADVDVVPPEEVSILPVFFVPKGEATPTADQKARLMKHLEWAQERYRVLLGGRDTFRIARETPSVCRGLHDLAFYKRQPESAAPYFVGEMLDQAKLSRFNCPYIFFTVVISPRINFPPGGGRPLNGGYNTGGGIVQISSFSLDRIPNVQSTIRHEIGHAMGLLHVSSYGYDMKANRSLMSYDNRHQTNGFRDSATPGQLIGEDLRGLAMNRRCLEKYRFYPDTDIPRSETISSQVGWLGPMKIVGHPSYRIEVKTGSGEAFESRVSNIVQKQIVPSEGPAVNFQASRMWHSDETTSGWVSLDLTFPFPVTLTKMGIHTQHSGQYHAAESVRIEFEKSGQWLELVEQSLKSVDADVPFKATRAQKWRIHLRAGPSKKLVMRGIRFFNESGEIFPAMVPYSAI